MGGKGSTVLKLHTSNSVTATIQMYRSKDFFIIKWQISNKGLEYHEMLLQTEIQLLKKNLENKKTEVVLPIKPALVWAHKRMILLVNTANRVGH